MKTGKCLKTWDFPTAVKRVEFNEDGTKLLGVTEKRMGHLGTIVVLDINVDVEAEQSDEKVMTIICDESKATVAGWSYMSKYIIAGHEDGSVSQYDGKTGDLLYNSPVHELNTPITRSSVVSRPNLPHHRFQGQDCEGKKKHHPSSSCCCIRKLFQTQRLTALLPRHSSLVPRTSRS